MLNFSDNNINPLHTNLQKGKDMTESEAHSIAKEYKEMKINYHMLLDKYEAKCEELTEKRKELMELKYQKKP